MNKGLEVIEAQHLFGVSTDRIEVVIHPQSIIHSMVSYLDGTVLAQLGIPNMKAAIAYALSYPERLPLKQPIPDFAAVGHLKFQQLEPGKFPCLELAFKASRAGGTLPAVLNAANEVAVHAFLNRQVLFTEIPEIIAKVVEEHPIVESPPIDDILAVDQWARERAEEVIRKIQG